MKTTAYFKFTRERADRKEIKDEWIENAIHFPIREVRQMDGRFKRWTQIEEAGGRYLRVIVLEDGETVHNAFFDRNFKR
jgi:hypothetical protein